MKNKTLITNIAIISLLVFLGIISRLIPHPFNFTPISAVALVITTYLGFRYSILGLFFIMLFSDSLIGFYDFEVMLSVYGSFIIIALMGKLIKREKPSTILFGALSGSLIFFFVTNWAVWQFGTMYPHNFSGLIDSYIMALPFFKNSLLGDMFYTTILFSTFEAFIFLKGKIANRNLEFLKLK